MSEADTTETSCLVCDDPDAKDYNGMYYCDVHKYRAVTPCEAETQEDAGERDLLTKLVGAWDRMKADSGLVETRHRFVEIQELIDQAREILAQSTPEEAPKRRIEVLVAEPHEYIRRHIKETLDSAAESGISVFGCTMMDNPNMVMDYLSRTSYDVVLLAFGCKLGGSIMWLRAIREYYRNLPVLMLGVSVEQQYLTDSLKNGAAGYLVTDAILDELVEAIRTVADGQTYTSKQLRVGRANNNDLAGTPGWEGAR